MLARFSPADQTSARSLQKTLIIAASRVGWNWKRENENEVFSSFGGNSRRTVCSHSDPDFTSHSTDFGENPSREDNRSVSFIIDVLDSNVCSWSKRNLTTPTVLLVEFLRFSFTSNPPCKTGADAAESANSIPSGPCAPFVDLTVSVRATGRVCCSAGDGTDATTNSRVIEVDPGKTGTKRTIQMGSIGEQQLRIVHAAVTLYETLAEAMFR